MSDSNQNAYRHDRFWNKVKSYALVAGQEVIEKALWLYYASRRKETPAWAKGIIYGALAYFILPFDTIPDLLPGVGYSDEAMFQLSVVSSNDVQFFPVALLP